MLLLILLALLSGPPDDQRPRPATIDPRGLLRINRDFYELAAKTGGDFYFWAAGEFATSRLEIPVVAEEVLLAYGEVERRRAFEIPVESGARSLTFFIGVQRKDLVTIVRPDGTVEQPAQLFRHMAITTIKSPVAGTWRLEIDGAGAFAATVHVTPRVGGIELIGAEFVEERGRPGHEGLFPVATAPPAGATVVCRLRVSGDARNVRLVFFSKDGTRISDAAVAPEGDGEFVGRCVVPSEAFRIGVTGVDSNGASLQRIERPLREPRS